MTQAFIEAQFPVSKVSKESYKERKANNGQTLTGLGKWWGRKPLVLVRAAALGCLLPATDNPAKDHEIFLRLMSMDDEGLLARKDKRFSAKELYERITADRRLSRKYATHFTDSGGKISLNRDAPRDEMEAAVFGTLGYDQKIAMCKRPEQLENLSESAWAEINGHLGTDAQSLPELVRQLSVKRFGHNLTVGDCFCGGGSIPFEAARIGCDVYASDLNPIAGLLTWADLHICGASETELRQIRDFQRDVYNAVDRKISDLGIERNEKGDRAVSYLYCTEARCPECGQLVPLAPSWVIGKGTKTVAILRENGDRYDIDVKMNATGAEMKAAERGTSTARGMLCPHCGVTTPISVLRRDRTDADGNTVYGLRQWEKLDFAPREDDVYQERLYAVKYEHIDLLPNGTAKTTRYYRAPKERDLENERKVTAIVADSIADWQEQGLIPSAAIEPGYNTEQPIRERGWNYWHQLFNARQLLITMLFAKSVMNENDQMKLVSGILGLNKCMLFNSRLSMWGNSPGVEKTVWIFTNQALNTMFNYGSSALESLKNCWFFPINAYQTNKNAVVTLKDARDTDITADVWITDPPYADAVNYDELSEVFISWDYKLLKKAFPEHYTDSKRVLAIRGDENFSQTMIDIYSNLARHMSPDGMQVVMFTHSDPSVWARLALIMWSAGLSVTAAWNIATETDASGLKDGNYVKGTVLLVLRPQTGDDEAFLDELSADIKAEVKRQIESMRTLDDKEDPNFSDPDYVLAAYAASLKVLTGYRAIAELDLERELSLAIHDPAKSEVVRLIERAKKLAYDFIIPAGFAPFLWRELNPAERFYIKGIENEKRGEYQISAYQEYARGFGLPSYGQLMASEKANSARLKTPSEFAMRTVSDAPGFEESVLRKVLAAVHIAVKEDENPQKGLWHLKTSVPDYWTRRDMLKELLAFFAEARDIDTMPHWKACAEMASHMYTLVDNDRI